ncbi:MAG TPA: glycosyltransferase [Terriglobales bacterium]|nr:glycosyltransferase [Terriglobales bacterium]
MRAAARSACMVSITIVTWNSARYLNECVAALATQECRDVEVIVVDNASADGTREILGRVDPSWRVIYNAENVGFAAGQNQAICVSRGEWVLCLNPDVVLGADFVSQLVRAGEAHSEAGWLCGKLLRWDPTARVEQAFRPASPAGNEVGREMRSTTSSPEEKLGNGAARGPEGPLYRNLSGTPESAPLPSTAVSPRQRQSPDSAAEIGSDPRRTNIIDSTGIYFTRNMRHLDRGAEEVDRGQYDRMQYVFGASGAAAMFRRSFIEDVSVEGEFFDEEFFAFREDGDLAWRAQVMGWKCLYVPAAVAWHVRRVTPERRRDLPLVINWHSAKNRFLMRGKNASGWLCRRLFFPVLWRDIMTYGYAIVRDRRLWSAVTYWWRARDSVRRKRANIQARRRISDRDLLWWFCDSARSIDVPRDER